MKMSTAVLSQILSTNQETEIGKKWNFKGISTIDEFRKKVPLTTYDNYKPYIDRIHCKNKIVKITNSFVSTVARNNGNCNLIGL